MWAAGLAGLASIKHWGLIWRIHKVEGLRFEGEHTVVALKVKPVGFAFRQKDMAIGEDLHLVEFGY